MTQLKNPLEVYKLLPKSNCRECLVPTCLAFSAAVIKGEKQLADCPYVTNNIAESLNYKIETQKTMDQNREKVAVELKSKMSEIDIRSSAERLGATIIDNKLAVKSLGKDFFVDAKGNITSECHMQPWVTIPLLDYILNCKEENIFGKWVPFREFKKGAERAPLFGQLCEKPLKHLADTYTDLFKDVIYIFSGNRTINLFSSDVSLILYPLPKIPILVCYWEPEGDIESSLHIFFDSSADKHIGIESIFALGVGLAVMFEKVALKHKQN